MGLGVGVLWQFSGSSLAARWRQTAACWRTMAAEWQPFARRDGAGAPSRGSGGRVDERLDEADVDGVAGDLLSARALAQRSSKVNWTV